jgi:hypothetical protein
MPAINFPKSTYTAAEGVSAHGWAASPSNGDTDSENGRNFTFSGTRSLWVLNTNSAHSVAGAATYTFDGFKWTASNIPDSSNTIFTSDTPLDGEVLKFESSGSTFVFDSPQNLISAASASQNGVMTAAQFTKLAGIETGATADLTAAEIKTAYESNSDTNEFSDAEQTKLAGIAAGAEVNVATNLSVSSTATTNVIASSTGTNATINEATSSAAGLMSTTHHDKLDNIEAAADVTDATNVDAAGAVMNSDTSTASMSFVVDEDNMSSNSATKVPTQQSVKSYVDNQVASVVDTAPAALDTLNELAAALGDDANFSTTVSNSIGTKLPLSGGTMTGNIVMSGSQTVDGRDLSADGAKLDGIAAGAEVNVQSDWNASSGDAQILNKPTIPAAYTNSSVDAHLNQSSASTGQTLIWNGSDYSWGTPAASYGNSNVDSHLNRSSASTGQSLTWNGSDYAWATVSGSGGDAATLDGIDSSSFLRSDTDDTMGARLTLTPSGFVSGIQNLACLNISSAGSAETRAIDIDGSWVANENKSISFIHGTSASNFVGQINCLYNGTGSEIRFGRFYHGADTSAYPVVIRSTSTSTADLIISGQIENASTAGASGAILGNLEVGYGANYNSVSARSNNSLHLNYNSTGTVYVGTNKTVWHSGNDGSGSGLDADTVDGVHASSFALLSGATFTGDLRVDNDADLRIGDGAANERILIQKANNMVSDHIIFYNGTTRVGEIGCQDTSWLRINQVTAKNIYTPRYIRADGGFFVDGASYGINGSGVLHSSTGATIGGNTAWHAGNDGSGSGLDADTLDGYQPTTGYATNTIVRRDGVGDARARHFIAGTSDGSGGWFRGRIGADTQITPVSVVTESNGWYYQQPASYFMGKTGTYWNVNNWLQFSSTHGLYYPNNNAYHLYLDGAYLRIQNSASANGIKIYSNSSGLRGYLYANSSSQIGFLNSAGSWSLKVDNSGNVTATGNVTAYSDVRIKENIRTVDNALDKVQSMRGVYFDRKDTGKASVGVIAQEIEQILPEVVETQDTRTDENKDGLSDLKTVSYGNIVGVLIEAIKELRAEVAELKEAN